MSEKMNSSIFLAVLWLGFLKCAWSLPPSHSSHSTHAWLHHRQYTTTTVQIFNVSHISMLSSDCASALGMTLDCSPLINSAAGYSAIQSDLTRENLTTLCTNSCSTALSAWRTNVNQACADELYTDAAQNATEYVYGTSVENDIYNVQGVSVKPVAFADFYVLGYELICLQDDLTPPNYCYELAQTNSSTDNLCGPCIINALRAQLEDPRVYDDSIANFYSELATSCSVTASALTVPTAVFTTDPNTIVANYSATPTCTGSYVTIPTGATCDEFANDNSVATSQMLMVNGLEGSCANWPGNLTQACIQRTCKTYQVPENVTCTSVASDHDITLSQLLSWNPSIDPLCKNFDQSFGHVICVGNPVGYIVPSGIATTYSVPPATTAPLPTNVATGSNQDCAQWYSVQKGDQCDTICAKFDIVLSDFLFLNPELNASCTNLYASESYCVEAAGDISTYSGYGGSPMTWSLSFSSVDWSQLTTASIPILSSVTATASYPLASGSLDGCSSVFENNYGDIPCWAAASLNNVDVKDFIRWNPSVLTGSTYNDTNCYLQNATEYCGSFYNQTDVPTSSLDPIIPAPSNAPSDVTQQCQSWYETWEGDTCDTVCQAYDISIVAFYSWNPSVGANCDSFKINTTYCVIGPGWNTVAFNSTASATITGETSTSIITSVGPATTTTSSTLSSSPTSLVSNTGAYPTPPAPTQTGIISTCDLYGIAQDNDGCYQFAARYGLTLTQLYAWNAVLNNACDNFWVNEAYCIGVPS